MSAEIYNANCRIILALERCVCPPGEVVRYGEEQESVIVDRLVSRASRNGICLTSAGAISPKPDNPKVCNGSLPLNKSALLRVFDTACESAPKRR